MMGMSDKELSQKVYTWARSKLGQKVDSGECWDLAHRALQHAGAQSSTTTGKTDDYVWGTPVPLTAVIAGDILQFRGHLVTTTVITDVTFEDKSGYEDSNESTIERLHHTAIVAENKGAFGLVVLEQNVDPGGKKVQRNALPLAGTLPVVKTDFRSMKDSSGRLRRAKVVVTTTTRVSGKIWAYRPRVKP
jgi:hypothetical protein